MNWEITIQNIAGIEAGSATVRPGINAVQAENWQGKSSFIEAMKVAHGTANTLTDGESEGAVDVKIGERTTSRRLSRSNGVVTPEGKMLLSDERDRMLAELFAFLDGDNPIRAAVRNGNSLEEVLTKPLDFENIDQQIAELQRERSAVESELQSAEQAERTIISLRGDISDLESELESLRAEQQELSEDGDEHPDETHTELGSLRAERDSLESSIESVRESIAKIEERLESKKVALDDLEIPEIEETESDISKLESSLSSVENDISIVQSVFSANRRVIDEDRIELLTTVDHGLHDDTVECWVCGSETSQDDIEKGLGSMDDELSSLRSAATDLKEEMEALRSELAQVRSKRARKRDLEREIADLESRLEERRTKLSTREDRLDSLTETIAELEETVQEQTADRTNLESEIKYVETRLSEKREEFDRLEAQAGHRDTLEGNLDELKAEIAALRDRKDTVKNRMREAFGESMAEVMDEFDPGFESARLTSTFDLVVARDGREVPIDSLSEGEVELLGIIVALAGHIAYDVGDSVDVILLDEVGGLSGENLSRLVSYLSDQAAVLVTTAYPEHTQLDASVIDPTAWTLTSR